jgi:hypothetical protein
MTSGIAALAPKSSDPVSNVLKPAWCCGACRSSAPHARGADFYRTTLYWQWMRLPGDVVSAAGALLMAWDFLVKAGPLLPRFLDVARSAPAPAK